MGQKFSIDEEIFLPPQNFSISKNPMEIFPLFDGEKKHWVPNKHFKRKMITCLTQQ